MIKLKIKTKISEETTASGLNAIEQHNLNFLMKYTFDIGAKGPEDISTNIIDDFGERAFDKTGDLDYIEGKKNPSKKKLFTELVKFVKPLSRSKIVRAITGMSYGKIFRLDNDHILKIYLGGVDPENDVAWYKKNYDLLHSGGAKQSTLAVYEFSDWSDGVFPSYPEYDVAYAEVAQYEPLDDFFKRTGRSEMVKVVSIMSELFEEYYNNGIKNIDQLQRKIYAQLPKRIAQAQNKLDKEATGTKPVKKIVNELTLNEFKSLIQTFHDMVTTGFNLSDVFPRNIGRLKQSKASNPVFVIYDR